MSGPTLDLGCERCRGLAPEPLSGARLCDRHLVAEQLGIYVDDPARAVAEASQVATAELERSGAPGFRPHGVRLLERADLLALDDRTRVELGLALLQNQVFLAEKSPRIIALAEDEIESALERLARSNVDRDEMVGLRAQRWRVSANLRHQSGDYGISAAMYERTVERLRLLGAETLRMEQLRQQSLLSASWYLAGQTVESRRLADETREEFESLSGSGGADYHMAKVVEHRLQVGAFDEAVELSDGVLSSISVESGARPIDLVVLGRDRAEGLHGVGKRDEAEQALREAREQAVAAGLTDQIRKLDGLATTIASPSRTRRTRTVTHAPATTEAAVDVLVIATTDFELLSILGHLGGRELPQHPRTMAERREISVAGDLPLVVGVVRGRSQGQTTAQRTARRAIEALRPSVAVLVGIAGALPSTEIFLGDVLMATSVLDLSVDARKRGGRQEWSAEPVGGLDPFVHDAAPMLPAWQRELETWPRIPDRDDRRRTLVKPEVADHPGSTEWDQEIQAAIAHARQSGKDVGPPTALTGALATSNTLHKDPEVVELWRPVLRKVLAVEMESAGVLAACDDAGVPALVVRGISDIVGLKRAEAWTRYASESAAVFLASLLRSGRWPRAS